MSELLEFPSTPHLAWLAPTPVRRDKVLTLDEATALLSNDVIVEEKVDGANVGIRVDASGETVVQTRGGWIGRGAHPQFAPLWPWLDARRRALADALGDARVLFGEWCFAVHSMRYDRLPDWFLAFDVYSWPEGAFLATGRRHDLCAAMSVAEVPHVASGRFTLESLVELLNTTRSAVGHGPVEGLYIRVETERHLLARAKLVRPEFAQAIAAHWASRPLEKNRLATASS